MSCAFPRSCAPALPGSYALVLCRLWSALLALTNDSTYCITLKDDATHEMVHNAFKPEVEAHASAFFHLAKGIEDAMEEVPDNNRLLTKS